MEDSTKNVRDPFDPFSDKEEVFETKNIKTSKAGRLKSKTPTPSASTKKKKPLPLSKRLKLALKSFSEREDKKRIFLFSGISLLLITGIIFFYTFFIEPWRREQMAELTDKITTEKAASFSMDVIAYENEEESFEDLEKRLLREINTSSDRKIKISALVSLADIYSDNGRISEAIEMLEKELETAETPSEKVQLMANLSNLYAKNGDKEKAISLLEQILEYPETENIEINGLPWGGVRETYLEEYNRMKNE